MVAGCPKCSARYRVDADRIGAEGAKLRCTKCSAVFLVRAPKAAPAVEPAPKPTPEPKPAAPPVASAPENTPVPQPAPPTSEPAPVTMPESAPAAEAQAPEEEEREYDRERLVVIADPDEARGKVSAAAVDSWGLQAHLVHDGVEAMLAIQRLLPSAVVLDAALPKMFGFQVCEVVKRNESLSETVVVLVGAIHHQDRYRRDPSDLYGADVYIEQPDLPDALQPVLRDGGLPIGVDTASAASERPTRFEAPAASSLTPGTEQSAAPSVASQLEPEDLAAPPPAPESREFGEMELSLEEPVVPAPSANAPEPELELSFEEAVESVVETPAASTPVDEDPAKTEERERALRLARIAVSEMLLYQPEKFDQAAADGSLERALDLEIQEARALLRQRVSEEVRAETDFILDELNRVASERGA